MTIPRLQSLWQPFWRAACLAVLALPLAVLADSVPDSPKFAIRHFSVDGNSKVTTLQIDAALAPYVGEGKDFSTIQSAIAAVTQLYKEAGFEAVRVVIPKQEIDAGDVRLQVVEAKLGTVEVRGNNYFDQDNVLNSLPSLRPGEIPNIIHLAADLRLANESFAKQTQVVFRQSEDPHAVDAVVKVSDDRPEHAAVSLDNTGTEQTGNWRLGFAYLNANMLDRDQTLAAQFVTSPGHWSDVKIYGLNYRIPLYRLGDAVEFSASHSNVNSGVVTTTSGSYGISGSGDNYGAHYFHLLPRVGDWDQRLNVGIDYRHFHDSISPLGGGGSLVPDTVVHPLSAAYVGYLRSPEREWGVTVGLVQNLPGGSDGNGAALRAVRQAADAGYSLLRYDFHVTQNLPRDWQLHAELDGQRSNDALVSGEQFGIGGVNSVRGFEERALANDEGDRASLELYSPDFASRFAASGVKLRAVFFIDAANATRNHALSGEATHNHLGSIGVGLRSNVGQHTTLRLDIADTRDDGDAPRSARKRAQASFMYLY